MDEHLDQPTDSQQEQDPASVDPRQLNALMHEVEDYNAQFSMGAMMARVVFRVMEQNELHSQRELDEGVEPPAHAAEEEQSQALTAATL